MKVKSSKPQRRIGRPPAGARAGERVKDYPQLSIRLQEDINAKLQAMSLVGSQPPWRIITEAIDVYLRDRPESEQQRVAEWVGRRRKKKSEPGGAHFRLHASDFNRLR